MVQFCTLLLIHGSRSIVSNSLIVILLNVNFSESVDQIQFAGMKNTNIVASLNDDIKCSLVRDMFDILYAPTTSPSFFFFYQDQCHALLNYMCFRCISPPFIGLQQVLLALALGTCATLAFMPS